LAKQCLILADKLLKESDFENARQEVAKAQKLDPTNPYAYAFLDRIAYFEEQKKKGSPAPEKTPATAAPPKKESPPVQAKPPVSHQQQQVAAKPASPQKPEPRPVAEPGKPDQPQQKEQAKPETSPVQPPPVKTEPVRPPAEEKPRPPVPPPPKKQPVESAVEASRSVIRDVMSSRSAGTKSPPSASTPGIGDVLQQISEAAHQLAPNAPKGNIESKLDEMRRQIEMLTNSLDQERKVREEINQQQLKGAVKQFRSALEKAWANGAPKDEGMKLLQDLAISLGITEDVLHTLNREVKLDMYSHAVKEVVSKQKLLRNSSRTLEWLRKVYQVSLDEYLEYESKFLMDLVADQYKGTILLVSGDTKTTLEVGQKLKSTGYAVVGATSPENALEKIEKINPHFILCDMEFSQGYLSGIKFLHVLRANSKFNYIPFILLCEKNEMTNIQSSELRPTEGCVEKPVELEQLNAVMNEKLTAFRQYLSSI